MHVAFARNCSWVRRGVSIYTRSLKILAGPVGRDLHEHTRSCDPQTMPPVGWKTVLYFENRDADQAEVDVIECVLRGAETISGVSGRLWAACPLRSELLNFTRSLFWFFWSWEWARRCFRTRSGSMSAHRQFHLFMDDVIRNQAGSGCRAWIIYLCPLSPVQMESNIFFSKNER